MNSDQQAVLDLVAEYELSEAETTPISHVLLSRPPEFDKELREVIRSLGKAGCIDIWDTYPNERLRLTPTGLLLCSRVNEIAFFAEALLSLFKERLRKEGARFREYTWTDLKNEGIVADDQDFSFALMIIQILGLSGSGPWGKASPPSAKFDIPPDIIEFRSFADIINIYLRSESKRQTASPAPSPWKDVVLSRLGSLDRHRWRHPASSLQKNKQEPVMSASLPDPSKVFVIHGRNTKAADEMSNFLRSLGLAPIVFNELRAKMGGTPTIADIVTRGMEEAKAVIALFTGDEYSSLHPDFRNSRDKEPDIHRWQARPNVLFEAGMAFGRDRNRVVFALLGDVELFTDVAGIHFLRPSNDPSGDRDTLHRLLKEIGCPINDSSAWMRTGDFESCVGSQGGGEPSRPLSRGQMTQALHQPQLAHTAATRDADKAIYLSLKGWLDSDWVNNWTQRQSNYPQWVDKEVFYKFREYLHEAQKPEREFFDEELQIRHIALLEELESFLATVGLQVVLHPANNDLYVIKTKAASSERWIEDYDERYQKEVDIILAATDRVKMAWREYMRAITLRFPSHI